MERDLERLFTQALELPPEQREDYLQAACPDQDTRRRVQALLRADDSATGFLQPPESADPLLGERLGPWRVIARIGEGGMSTVYRAQRDDGAFTMDAAVKVLRPALASDTFLRRFHNEREVLARLVHPNIARLLDGGMAEGRPYLVMELVDGVPLHAWCEQHSLSLEERLRLVITVCEAVQAAHRRLVVHRDIKPSNVLVDGEGTVKLLDFGIAKALEPGDSHPDVAHTRTQDRVFTPSYASPEQVQGEVVTTATDVYSIGVMLYRLLTGRLPYEVEDTSPTEVARVICSAVPPRPSTVSPGPGIPESPRKWARGLSGDLDNIVLKALRKEPERRYESVEGFAEDLRRHLDGRPVEARPDTVGYRTRRFVRRNRLAVGAAAAVFTVVLAAAVVSTLLYIRAESSRREAELALQQAEVDREQSSRIASFLSDMLVSANPTATQDREAVTVDEVLDRASERLAVELADQPEVAVGLYHTLGVTRRQLAQYEEARRDLGQALELHRGLGDGSAASIDTRYELGRALADGGDPQASLPVLDEATALADALGPEGASRKASILRAKAQSLVELGRLDEAEATARRAVELRRGLPEPDSEKLASDLNQLGLLLVRQGKNAQAEPVLRETLETLTAVHGTDHSVVAQARNNLAWCLIRTNRFEEAIPLLEAAVAVHETVYAPDHPNLLAARSNLARCYQENRRFAEAKAIYRSILEGFRGTVGPDHPSFAHALNNLGFTLLDEERYLEADSLFSQAVGVYRAALGEMHPYTAIAESNRARALRGAEQFAKAEAHALASLRIRRDALREGHPDIAGSAELVGRIRMDRGDLSGAEAMLLDAVSLHSANHGAGSRLVAECLLLRGTALAGLGRLDEAHPLLLRSAAVLDSLGADEELRARAHRELERWSTPPRPGG